MVDQANPTTATAWAPRLSAAPAIWQHDRALSGTAVRANAARLAARLPQRPFVLNACSDRAAFIVSFLAALERRQVTLLATDRSHRAMQALRSMYPSLYVISDEASPPEGFETITLDPVMLIDGDALQLTLDENQVAAIALTSGSTGAPIGHPKSVATLAATAGMIAAQVRLQPGRSTIVATVPPQHMYGLELSVLMPVWGGVTAHAGRPLYPADVAAALSEVPAPRHLVTTPVHLRALVESRIPLPQVESIVVASAPLSLSLAKRAEEVFATTVIDLYGCTEAGTIATRQPTQGSAWTPCAGIALRATDAGCVVSGPHLPRPVVVNDAIDVMLDGTFFLHGRSDDQIKIAGRRTSLSALNSILTGVEGVLDGTFVAVPTLHDPERSRLIAFVVSPGLTAAQVTAALQNNLDPALLPHQVHLVAALPRLPTGKLPVAKLAELVASATEAHGRG